jgi:hypothetical protein
MALPISRVLPMVGTMNALIYAIPGVGETLVRAMSTTTGKLLFRLPLLGGTPAQHVGNVHDQWLRFLGLMGIRSKIVTRQDGQFVMTVDACPYGYEHAGQEGVCDACMDLDRAYVQAMGARFEIEERIPDGAHQCRFRISFP